jgi:hypothetical protein
MVRSVSWLSERHGPDRTIGSACHTGPFANLQEKVGKKSKLRSILVVLLIWK